MSLSLCRAQDLSVADFLQCFTPQSRNMEGLLFYTKTCKSILISYEDYGMLTNPDKENRTKVLQTVTKRSS